MCCPARWRARSRWACPPRDLLGRRGSASRDLRGQEEGAGGHLAGLGDHKSRARLRITPCSWAGGGCAHWERSGAADLGLSGWRCPRRPHPGLSVGTGPVTACAPETRPRCGSGLGPPAWKVAGVWKPRTWRGFEPGEWECDSASCQSCPGDLSSEGRRLTLSWQSQASRSARCLMSPFFPSFLPSNAASRRSWEREVACAAPRRMRHGALVVASDLAPDGAPGADAGFVAQPRLLLRGARHCRGSCVGTHPALCFPFRSKGLPGSWRPVPS